MLSPKKTKYRKAHKGRIHGNAKGGNELAFGSFGLKSLEPERVTARQIEAARRAAMRHIKRLGRLWIRIFQQQHLLSFYSPPTNLISTSTPAERSTFIKASTVCGVE